MKTAEEIFIEASLTQPGVVSVYPWQIEAAKKYAKQFKEQYVLTKREAIAIAAMQGILSGHVMIQPNQCDEVAEYAIKCADALIVALSKTDANG